MLSERTLLMLRDIARMVEEQNITIDAYVTPMRQLQALQEAMQGSSEGSTYGSHKKNADREKALPAPLQHTYQ